MKHLGLLLNLFKMITKQQFLEITKAGFDNEDFIKIDIETVRMSCFENTYYLHNPNSIELKGKPTWAYLIMTLNSSRTFLEFLPAKRPFNHLAAILMMEQIGIINKGIELKSC